MNRPLLSLSAFLIIVVACSATTIESDTTSVPWLGECSSDAECESTYSCLCGVCSLRCASPDFCSELDPTASCFEPDQTASTDCVSNLGSQPGICVGGCSDANPCEGNESCVEGSCIPASATTALGVVDAGSSTAVFADASGPVPNPAVGAEPGEACCDGLGQCVATEVGGVSGAGWTGCADNISVCLPTEMVEDPGATEHYCSTDIIGDRGNPGRCLHECFVRGQMTVSQLRMIRQSDCPVTKICVPCESGDTPTGFCDLPGDTNPTEDTNPTRDATAPRDATPG